MKLSQVHKLSKGISTYYAGGFDHVSNEVNCASINQAIIIIFFSNIFPFLLETILVHIVAVHILHYENNWIHYECWLVSVYIDALSAPCYVKSI